MSFTLMSPAFEEGGTIAKKYTCDGPDLSPPLKWTDPPAGTQSLVLIVDDPDAPVGTWVHWVLYNVPPETREFPEGQSTDESLKSGGKQGINDFRKVGYGGPCPPKGPAHRYIFKLYALDTMLQLGPKPGKGDVEKGMKGHVLAETRLMGKYGR